MRKTFLYLLGGQLASISIPVMAQEAPPDAIPEEVGGGTLTPDQMAAYDAWSPERQAQYDAWPTDAQAFFWTLPAARQGIFWMLRDEDKLALVTMDDNGREQAWVAIEQSIDTAPPDPKPETEPAEPADSTEPEGR